jgi:hypothetical protein
LLHKGWTLTPSNAEVGINLVAPDKGCEVPLCFKMTSLALYAHIRVVSMADDDHPTSSCPIATIEEQDELPMVIQTVIPTQDLLARIFRRVWSTTQTGNPFVVMPDTKKFMDPSMMFSSTWPLRTAMIQRRDYKWEVVEHSVPYYTQLKYASEIEQCQGVKAFVLIILHKKEEPPTMFGTLGDGEVVQAGGPLVDTENFVCAPEPNVPMEMQEGLKPEELAQMDAGRGLFGDVEKLEWTIETRDALTVGSTIIGRSSAMGLLRAAADYLGISKGGSKATLCARLNQALQQLENQQLFQDANRMYRQQDQHPGRQMQAQPREPTQQERLLHEHTHTPFEAGVSGVLLASQRWTWSGRLHQFQKKAEKFPQSNWIMPMGR